MDVNYRRIVATLAVFAGLCLTLYSCSNTTTWEEAKKADTYEAYRAYIEEYPEGEHVAEARKFAEKRYWNAIKNDTTAKVFQKYLDQFPDGKHKLEAQLKFSQLSSGGGFASKARVTGSSVIIRSGHTTESPSVGVVAKERTIVQILDWHSVGSNNEALLKRSITVVNNGNRINLTRGKAVQILADLNDSVHVSFATSHNASVEATISKKVVESMSGQMWYKIHTRDGITGWIYGEFIEVL